MTYGRFLGGLGVILWRLEDLRYALNRRSGWIDMRPRTYVGYAACEPEASTARNEPEEEAARIGDVAQQTLPNWVHQVIQDASKDIFLQGLCARSVAEQNWRPHPRSLSSRRGAGSDEGWDGRGRSTDLADRALVMDHAEAGLDHPLQRALRSASTISAPGCAYCDQSAEIMAALKKLPSDIKCIKRESSGAAPS